MISRLWLFLGDASPGQQAGSLSAQVYLSWTLRSSTVCVIQVSESYNPMRLSLWHTCGGPGLWIWQVQGLVQTRWSVRKAEVKAALSSMGLGHLSPCMIPIPASSLRNAPFHRMQEALGGAKGSCSQLDIFLDRPLSHVHQGRSSVAGINFIFCLFLCSMPRSFVPDMGPIDPTVCPAFVCGWDTHQHTWLVSSPMQAGGDKQQWLWGPVPCELSQSSRFGATNLCGDYRILCVWHGRLQNSVSKLSFFLLCITGKYVFAVYPSISVRKKFCCTS